MPYNPHIHHRRSIRLKGYDYSHAGMYLPDGKACDLTICVKDRECFVFIYLKLSVMRFLSSFSLLFL